jgi:hypothetical protein
MYGILKASLFPLSALLLMAADSSWRSRQVEQWTEEDAKQVLIKSPWVQKATPRLLPKQSEAAQRNGGKMGGSQGVGVQALTPAILLGAGGKPNTHGARPSLLHPLEIRWESAGPVRVAETKSHEEDAPDLEGGLYAIAVYDVPGLDIDQKSLATDLKRESSLSRDGKKDLKPSKVDLLPQADGLTTVVFLFPRTDAISIEDKRIKFTAVFDHLAVAQYFYTKDMQFQGKLDL